MSNPRSPPARVGAARVPVLLLALVLVSGAVAAAPRADPDDRFLLVLAPGATPASAGLGERAVVESFDAASGVAVVRGDPHALRGHASVRSIEPDGVVRVAGASWDRASWDGASWDRASWDRASWDRASWDRASWDGAPDALPPAPWALDAIHAPDAWARGVPVGTRLVCLVDSGVDAAHPLLADRLWPRGLDLVRGDATPDDEAGHGTHLAGIVAAAADDVVGFRGVGAPLLASAKALGPDGTGRTSDVIEGIAWCRAQGAHVILLALTEDAPTRAFHAAIQAARRGGALLVASAGNGGPCEGCVSYPAAYPEALAVAAFGADGRVAGFSAKGPQVDLAAPGAGILSTFPGNALRIGSGTSQAAAHVAGAAALLWAQSPGLAAGDVERALLRDAADDGRAGRDAASGFGFLDLAPRAR